VIRRRGAARPAADLPVAGPAGPAAGDTAPADAPPAGTAPAGTAPAGTAPAGTAPGGTGAGAALPRRRDPWKVAFFGVAIVAILAGTVWALLGSKFLVVRSVEVTGPAAVSRAEVIADAGIRLGTPLVRVNLATVARRVEQVTLVQSAQVRRAWPDKIVISVQERTAVLAVPRGGGYELIDKFGVILRQAARRPHGMPVLHPPAAALPSSLRGSPAVLAAAAVLRELPVRLARSVRTIDAPDADTVTLRLRGGITIVWGGTGQRAAKARELAILMRGHARYYDVSDPQTPVTGR
jgi:cell division protein FtsQ